MIGDTDTNYYDADYDNTDCDQHITLIVHPKAIPLLKQSYPCNATNMAIFSLSQIKVFNVNN